MAGAPSQIDDRLLDDYLDDSFPRPRTLLARAVDASTEALRVAAAVAVIAAAAATAVAIALPTAAR